MQSNELRLKGYLFDKYDGFADKRIKKLENGDLFIVDDRSSSDFGANGKPYSSLCMMFLRIVDLKRLEVDLVGNVPLSTRIRTWIQSHGAKLEEIGQTQLTIPISLGDEDTLRELASLIKDIVKPSTPRYDVPSYKYACPRTANSLERLADNLEEYRTTKRGILKIVDAKRAAENSEEDDL